MNITATADRQVFEQALKAARTASQSLETTDLNTPGDATLRGRLDEAWDTIEAALRRGYQLGSEMAKDILEKGIAEVEQLLTEAGSRARDLHESLLQRLRTYVQNFVNGTLALVPTTVTVGDKTYNIDKLTYTQKILMGGSIKANLIEVSSLTSNGELTVAVDYVIAR